jgi:TonB family protein
MAHDCSSLVNRLSGIRGGDSTTSRANFPPWRAAVESKQPVTYNPRSILIAVDQGSDMIRSLTIAFRNGVLCAVILCVLSTPVRGQTSPEILSLATRTADRVAKTHQQHIFVAGLQECHLDDEICASFDAALHAELTKMIPGVSFIKRESIINILEGRGFLAIDAYFPDVLKAVAKQAGADILVTSTLKWHSDGEELISEVYDGTQGKKLDQFRVKMARPPSDSSEEPLVFKDPGSGTSLIISKGSQSYSSPVKFPKCLRCPDPSYTPEARANRIQGRVLLMVTVTEKGEAVSIGIVDGLDGGLTGQAVEVVRTWQFKPATGEDGKPIATRVPIEVTFRLK